MHDAPMQPAMAVPTPAPHVAGGRLAALCGATAAALALGLSELVAGLIGGATSLVAAIGFVMKERCAS